MKEYFEKSYIPINEKLDEMAAVLHIYHPPILKPGFINRLNSSTIAARLTLPRKKCPGLCGFTAAFYQRVKDRLRPMLPTLLHEAEGDMTPPNPFCDASTVLLRCQSGLLFIAKIQHLFQLTVYSPSCREVRAAAQDRGRK